MKVIPGSTLPFFRAVAQGAHSVFKEGRTPSFQCLIATGRLQPTLRHPGSLFPFAHHSSRHFWLRESFAGAGAAAASGSTTTFSGSDAILLAGFRGQKGLPFAIQFFFCIRFTPKKKVKGRQKMAKQTAKNGKERQRGRPSLRLRPPALKGVAFVIQFFFKIRTKVGKGFDAL
jgi:hypothetical protein